MRVVGYVVQYPVLYLHFPSILLVSLAHTDTLDTNTFGLAEYQLSRRSADSELEYIVLSLSCFPPYVYLSWRVTSLFIFRLVYENQDAVLFILVAPRVSANTAEPVAWKVHQSIMIGALAPFEKPAELDAVKSPIGQNVIFFALYIPYAI